MFEEVDNFIFWLIVTAFTMPLLLLSVLIWFFLSYQKKKYQYEVEKKDTQLREQSFIIEQQNVIQAERNRIATEMHDELGAGLTVIKYISDSVVYKLTDEQAREDINKIAHYSTSLVRNMSEIIWAMNSRFDNVEGLIGYIRRYAAEFLEDHHIEHYFKADDLIGTINISGEKRRNIYLVIKELLHNAVKHSGAQKIQIEATSSPDLVIRIVETGGQGFIPENMEKEGNGLYNIQKRMSQIGGKLHFHQTPTGMEISIMLPIPNEDLTKNDQIIYA